MTRVIILGATGPTDINITKEFLRAYPDGWAILYVRNPSNVPSELSPYPQITVVKGDLTDARAFASVFKPGESVDAVLSALGPVSPPPKGQRHPITHIYEALLPVIAANTKRIVSLSTIAFKDPRDKFNFMASLITFLIWLLARASWEDVTMFSPLIVEESEKHGVAWTILRVPFLTNAEGQKTVAGYLGDGKVGAKLSRVNLAQLFVQAIEDKRWVRKSPAMFLVYFN